MQAVERACLGSMSSLCRALWSRLKELARAAARQSLNADGPHELSSQVCSLCLLGLGQQQLMAEETAMLRSS